MNTLRTSRTRGSVQFCRLAGCLTALAIAAPAVLQAQDATPAPAAAAPAAEGTGSVSGRVMNAGNGMYLGKAVIKVVGTNIEYITDDYGFYTLNNVPAGNITLNVTYTGLNPTTQEVTVKAGETSTQDIKLSRTRLSVDKSDKDAVILDEFQVETERFKNAAEIAINEERYSPTIKNVVSADAFGDIPDGNIGEFVKFIPGVQVGTGYDNAGSMNALDQNISQVSVRGFSPDMTAITIDGVPVTNASPASLSRSIGLDMMSVNNASRVEVIKVPTPDMPSNSPGGAINLVTRSAFEQSKPTLRTKLMFNMNSEDFRDFGKKTPGPANESTYKSLPGVEFSYTIPFTRNFGISVSGGWSQTFYENHQAKSDYLYDPTEMFTADTFYNFNAVGGGTGGRVKLSDGSRVYYPLISSGNTTHSPWNPLLYRFQATDTPNIATRFNGSLKLDWKPTSSQKLSTGYTYGKFDTVDAQRRLQFYNGNKYAYLNWGEGFVTGMPYTANGMSTVSTANGTIGALKPTLLDPKATINMNVTTRDRAATTHTGYVDYKFQRGPWTIDANVNGSKSEGSYTDLQNGHFSDVETSITGGQLVFENIQDGIPGKIRVFSKPDTSTGQVSMIDWTRLTNWSTLSEDGLKAKSGDTHASDTSMNAKVNLRRDLDFLPFNWMTASIKTGWYHQEQTAKKWGLGTGYYVTYNAAKAGNTLKMTDYLDDGYDTSPGFGLPAQQWLDNYKLYSLWKDNPDAFGVYTPQNESDNYKSWASQQKNLKETSDQWYVQLDGRALKNRLNWVAGLRGEMATRKGYNTRTVSTWNFLHNDLGKIWRDTSIDAYKSGIKIDSASSILFKGLTFTKNADGTYTQSGGTLEAAGVALRQRLDAEKIWYPTAPIDNNTLAAAKLQRIPFDKVNGRVTNKPNFMTSVAYDITKNLTGRLSYSKTSGRPDWENGILSVGGGSIDFSESSDPAATLKGTVIKPNPSLKPSDNNSYDAQLAYYTSSGGKLAVSGFYKETKNPQETIIVYDGDPRFDELLEVEQLNPDDFRGWAWKTTVNTAGTGKTIGYEVEASQDLGIFGGFGKAFNVFASFSHHYKKQNNTTYLTLKPSAGSSASGGVNFAWKRLNILTRWVWLEEKYLGTTNFTINNETYQLGRYTPSTVNVDLNVRYKLSERFSLFYNGRNVLNSDSTTIRHDEVGKFPTWAKVVETKRYGVTMVFGIEASF